MIGKSLFLLISPLCMSQKEKEEKYFFNNFIENLFTLLDSGLKNLYIHDAYIML